MHILGFLMFLTSFIFALAVMIVTILQNAPKMVAAFLGRSVTATALVSDEPSSDVIVMKPRRKPRVFTTPRWEPLPLAA
jgi:hypothetical protein